MAGVGTLRGQVNGEAAYVYAGMRHALFDLSWSHHPALFVETRNTATGPGNPTIECCDPDESIDAGITAVRRRWRTTGMLRLGVEATDDRQARRRGFSIGGTLGPTLAGA